MVPRCGGIAASSEASQTPRFGAMMIVTPGGVTAPGDGAIRVNDGSRCDPSGTGFPSWATRRLRSCLTPTPRYWLGCLRHRHGRASAASRTDREAVRTAGWGLAALGSGRDAQTCTRDACAPRSDSEAGPCKARGCKVPGPRWGGPQGVPLPTPGGGESEPWRCRVGAFGVANRSPGAAVSEPSGW